MQQEENSEPPNSEPPDQSMVEGTTKVGLSTTSSTNSLSLTSSSIIAMQKVNAALQLPEQEMLSGRPVEGNNWADFLYYLEVKFSDYDLWDHGAACPRFEAVTLSHLRQNLKPALRQFHKDLKTSEALWKHLVEIYSGANARQQPQVLDMLMDLQLTDDMDVELVKLDGIISKLLASFGPGICF
jgi:hypothetical protein